ncbi:MAG: alpha/beta hydrolase [Gammaproteobacteria bacterium]|nr:alpha/beta hydrolase [Gammaproteobacteria bacterium]MBQ0838362.1 alpha/beta hydrolase [Gammaproteobacteria bacterium]
MALLKNGDRLQICRIVLLLSFAGILSGCTGLLFFPSKEWVQKPDSLGLDYQNLELIAADGTPLNAWFLPVSGKARGSILFLHGNAENISTHIHSVRWLPAAGYQVLLLDYRGFGQSKGHPNLPDVFLDIDAAMVWLNHAQQSSAQPLYILGQSIGASLMLYAASQYTDNRALCALISDAAFTRYGAIAGHVAKQSWLSWPLQFPLSLFGRAYDPIDGVSSLGSVPILFYHSVDDEIIPFNYLDQLVAAHSGPSQRVVTSGPHTATFFFEENRRILLEFLSRSASSGACNRAH